MMGLIIHNYKRILYGNGFHEHSNNILVKHFFEIDTVLTIDFSHVPYDHIVNFKFESKIGKKFIQSESELNIYYLAKSVVPFTEFVNDELKRIVACAGDRISEYIKIDDK